MKKVMPLVSLILVVISILLLINGLSGISVFYNPYSLIMFLFIVYALTAVKFGFLKSCESFKMFLFVTDVDDTLQSIYHFKYKISYMVALACFVSGSIIIFNDVDKIDVTNLVQSFSVNLLVVFYSIVYSEFFCRLNIK